jgi:hypothetical protein
MRVEEAIGRQVARLRAPRQPSLADLGEALGRYLGKPWSRQAVRTDLALGACLLGGTRVRLVISPDPGTGAQTRPPTGAGTGVLK